VKISPAASFVILAHTTFWMLVFTSMTSAYLLHSTRCRTINLQSLFQSMYQFTE